MKITATTLPQEILLMIFKHFSTNERKPVKLVCKAWFEVCNVFSLLNDEVLTCLGVYQLSDIYELLNRSERGVLNLKFYNVKFVGSSSFWKHRGPEIQSIHFIDCEFSNNILDEIIISVENLLHLSLIYTPQYEKNMLQPISSLDGILRNDIIRESLCFLEIDFLDSMWISNYTIYQLFLIFPKVKILKISCTVVDRNFEKVDLDLSDFTSQNNFTFSPILNYLMASTKRIEKLKLHFPNNEFSVNFLNRIFETLTAMTRLIEVSINMRGTPQSEFVEAFIRSKHLKSLEYCMKMNSSLDFFLQLLLSSPSLEFLKIDSLIVTKIFYEKLMSSNLKSLEVTDLISIQNPDTCRSLFSSTSNTVLHNLSIFPSKYDLDEAHLSLFLESFQNLNHLKLTSFTQRELQSVFKNQTKLKTLILRNSYGPINDFQIPSKSLKNIEYLEVPWLVGPFFLKYLSAEPILAKLKYLHIEIAGYTKCYFSDLLKLTDIIPFLEGLYVYYDHIVGIDSWLKLCVKLRRLRYLYFTNKLASKFTNEEYKKLFIVCPSLRAVVYNIKCGEKASYFFDTIKHEVVQKQEDYLYPLYIPKINEVTVDWLNF